MKNIKKLLSIVMVLTLVLSLGASAFASTVTINDADANSTYTAYELLTATYNETTKLYQYHLNEKFADAIKAGFDAVGVTLEKGVTADNENAVVEAINDLKGDAVRKFADAAFAAIQADDTMKAAGKDTVEGNNKQFSDMEGYYLIAETAKADNAVTSLVMLGTYGDEDTSVTTKEDHPSSEKKVKEKNDTNGAETDWQDAADYDVNDIVPYQLKAKIQGQGYEKYTTYSLKFVDTLSKGLTYEETTAVYYIDAAGQKQPLDIVNPTSALYAGEDKTYEGGTVLTWSFDDLKALGVPAGATVYVEYTATLNGGAVIGSKGNPNTMHIEYSNNPYGEGTGETPDDKVTVFTFDLDVNKVDGAGEALKGAGFTLLKKVPSIPEEASVAESLTPSKNEDGSINDSTYPTAGKYYKDGEASYEIVGVIKAGDVTKFEFDRLDSGEYLLVESVVPEGYNKAEDVEISITATYDTDNADPALTDLKVTPDSITVNTSLEVEAGLLSTTVTNLTGVELPSTGGIGTTIFYVVGAILVAGAVILLVSKKRASGAEK